MLSWSDIAWITAAIIVVSFTTAFTVRFLSEFISQVILWFMKEDESEKPKKHLDVFNVAPPVPSVRSSEEPPEDY